ncbi:hypothetical protein CWC05_23845, partial [Pseudoalteromonas ruthenica]
QEEVEAISTEINLALPEPKKVTSYTRSQYVLPKQGQTLVWQEDITVADVAIVDMHVHPVPGYPQKAQGLVLQSHFRQHAFEVLRT